MFEVLKYVVAGVVGLVIGYLLGRRSAAASVAVRKKKDPAKRAKSGKGQPQAGASAPGVVELYVGNLSYDTADADLEKAFSEFGNVVSVRIIGNRANGRSKGFGFVELDGVAAANKAAKVMNGSQFMGRKIVVNTARAKSKES